MTRRESNARARGLTVALVAMIAGAFLLAALPAHAQRASISGIDGKLGDVQDTLGPVPGPSDPDIQQQIDELKQLLLQLLCDPATEVIAGGACYYLDGSNGACDPGYVLAPQSVLTTIAPLFVGKIHKHQVHNNCCIKHANQATEGQDWGMSAQCGTAGPFTVGPVLGGAGCTDQDNNYTRQLTLCFRP